MWCLGFEACCRGWPSGKCSMHSRGRNVMKKVSKTTNSVLCSLLFISIACERVAAFGNNPKTQPRNLQVTDSDSPREVLKKALSAAQKVTSYRVRIEAPSVPKSAIVMEYASPDRAHMFTMTEEKARV